MEKPVLHGRVRCKAMLLVVVAFICLTLTPSSPILPYTLGVYDHIQMNLLFFGGSKTKMCGIDWPWPFTGLWSPRTNSPSTRRVDIASTSTMMTEDAQDTVSEDSELIESPKHLLARMSIKAGPEGMIHQPIHESVTLAAMINGSFGVAQGTTVDNVDTHDWEYIRGAVWNDDLDGLLFDDNPLNNHAYSTGTRWAYEYKTEDGFRNPTGRSHHGSQQFFHCTASKSGEKPGETRREVMVWLEVMYKLASGEDGLTGETLIGDTKLSEFYYPVSLPPSSKSLRYLLSKDSAFRGVDVQRRAMGSMFHVIQDSYAIGHTRRALLNPQDKQSNSKLSAHASSRSGWPLISYYQQSRSSASQVQQIDGVQSRPSTPLVVKITTHTGTSTTPKTSFRIPADWVISHNSMVS